MLFGWLVGWLGRNPDEGDDDDGEDNDDFLWSYLLVEIVLLLEEVELLTRHGELLFELGHLVLQDGNDSQTAVHRVLLSCISLVGDGLHGVLALAWVNVLEDAQDVGDSEQLVHVLEPLRLVGWEVG